MKITYKEFRKMSLRPAFYNGTQFEIDVIFDGTDLHREGITPTKALHMIVGDTVRVRGMVKADGKDNDYDYISIYICGEELEDFINRYGVDDINATVTLKLESVYATYDSEQFCSEPATEEITGYKYVCTVFEGGQEQSGNSDEICDETPDSTTESIS